MVLVAPALAETDLKPAHKIDEVVVYPDRAMITRKASLQLAPGAYRVVFSGLPKNLQVDSVRAGGTGSAQVLMHGLEVDSVPVGESPSKVLEAAEKKVADLEQQDRTQQDLYKIHERQMKLLGDLVGDAARGFVNQLANSKAQLTEWGNTLAFLRARQAEAAKGMQDAEQARKRIAQEKQKAQAELNKLRAYKQEMMYQVPVSLEVRKGGAFTLELSYMVPGASWSSMHEARLDATSQNLNWVTLGSITQRTGEDWQDVALQLSTARPSMGSQAPSLPDWWLSLYRPDLAAKSMRAPRGYVEDTMPAPAPEQEAGDDAGEGLMQRPTSEVQDQGTSITLAIPRRVTIPSDGRAHQAPIGDFNAKVKSHYTAIPRQMQAAYLDVELANQAKWPLMPGTIKSFVGNNYVGNGRLSSMVAPKEEFQVGMGVDDTIHVERERVERKTGERGVISKNSYVTYRYKLTLANGRQSPQAITVFEPLPRVSDDKIKVMLDGVPSVKGEEEPGRLRWNLVLTPSRKETIEWGYTVEYPHGMSIAGLE